jgi:dihydroorotate dehydrogenase
VDLRKGIAINAVGLSNFGIARALAKGAWQRRTEPFMLSFMPISRSAEDRLAETAAYLSHLRDALPSFRAPLALQVNLSCPNTGEDLRELEEEAADILRILTRLEIPLLPKFNVLTAPETVARLHERVPIDGVCVSNTIPYGLLKEKIDWERMFGAVSPLAGLGGGGLSGAPLLPLVREWVAHARRIGLSLPINAGGGILHPAHVRQLFKAGADSVSVASVIMLRPWRLPSIIREAERHRFL